MSSARVTITLPAGLLAEVDRYVREHPGLSRSAVCAMAITVWLQAEPGCLDQRGTINDQSPAERQGDDRWRRLASQSAATTWDRSRSKAGPTQAAERCGPGHCRIVPRGLILRPQRFPEPTVKMGNRQALGNIPRVLPPAGQTLTLSPIGFVQKKSIVVQEGF